MLPDGYTARALDFVEVDGLLDGSDVDLAHSVVQAADIGVLAIAEASRESTRANLANPDALVAEHRLVFSPDGAPVGLLMMEKDPAAKTFYIDSYAAPQHGRALLAPLLDMGIEVAGRLRESDDWKIEAGAFEQDEVYVDTLVAAGFHEVRRFWHMHIELTPDHLADPEPPDGVTMTAVESDADRRTLHEIDEVAFAAHFGFVPHPYEDWISWFSDRRDARPDLWWLAWHDGEPVGLCIQDDSRTERNAGHVRVLGVVPSARGRGIARWLLQRSFAQAAGEGRTAMTLTVDSDNTTGATALYDGVGMRPERVIVLFRRPA